MDSIRSAERGILFLYEFRKISIRYVGYVAFEIVQYILIDSTYLKLIKPYILPPCILRYGGGPVKTTLGRFVPGACRVPLYKYDTGHKDEASSPVVDRVAGLPSPNHTFTTAITCHAVILPPPGQPNLKNLLTHPTAPFPV
jgi:hypothetical protein